MNHLPQDWLTLFYEGTMPGQIKCLTIHNTYNLLCSWEEINFAWAIAADVDDDEMEDNGKMIGGPDPFGLGIKIVCWVEDEDGGNSSFILLTVAEEEMGDTAIIKAFTLSNDNVKCDTMRYKRHNEI